MRTLSVAAVAVGAAFVAVTAAAGQAVGASGVRLFASAYFERFNAATALDMVRQLPGFVFRDSDRDTRGYAGSAGNVLINGRRPSGKAVSLQDTLARIPAGNIASVELVPAGAPGYETGQDSVVANVVLHGEASASTTVEASLLAYDDDHVSPSFEWIRSSVSADRSWSISLGSFSDHHAWRGTERLYDGAGALVSERRFHDPWTFKDVDLTFNLEQALNPDAALQFQVYARGFDFDRPGFFDNFEVDSLGVLAPRGRDLSRSDRWAEEYEINPVIEASIADVWRVEGRALARTYTFNDASRSELAATGVVTESRQVRTDREFLARAAVTRHVGAVGALEFGAESALNSRDQDLAITVDAGSGPTRFDLPGANAKVEERRSEIFTVYAGTLAPRISTEAGLRYEQSTITRTGGDANEQSFAFLKPALRLRFDQTPRRHFRVSAERLASQLNFADYLSIIDFAQGGQLNGGNPTLAPSTRWRFEAGGEQRFASGSVAGVVFFDERISDVIDRAPVFGGAFDAPANIGDARRRGVTLNVSAPLDVVGLADARLDVTGSVEQSEVTDPVTGETRELSGAERHAISMELRKRFPARDLNVNLRLSRTADARTFRLDRIDVEPNVTEGYAYVESTRVPGVVMRFGLDYLFDEEDDRRFITFVGDRASGVVDTELVRTKRQSAFLNVQIRATF